MNIFCIICEAFWKTAFCLRRLIELIQPNNNRYESVVGRVIEKFFEREYFLLKQRGNFFSGIPLYYHSERISFINSFPVAA